MAASNWNACLKFTLRYEGGYVNHPADPGGATNLGITRAVLAAWRKRSVSVAEVKALKVEEAALIYKANYWNLVKGDDLPAGVDLAVWDFAVNSGVSRGAKALQAAVGTRQDGVIGSMTLAAVEEMHPGEIVKRICDNRLTFLQRLKTWSTFGRGWGSRVSAVRAAGAAMVAGAPIHVTVAAAPADAAQKAPTTDVAPQKTSAGAGTITVGVAGSATALASAGDLIAAGKSIQSFSDALPWLAAVGSVVVGRGYSAPCALVITKPMVLARRSRRSPKQNPARPSAPGFPG